MRLPQIREQQSKSDETKGNGEGLDDPPAMNPCRQAGAGLSTHDRAGAEEAGHCKMAVQAAFGKVDDGAGEGHKA